MTSDVLNELRNVLFMANSLKTEYKSLFKDIEDLNKELNAEKETLKRLVESEEYYKKAVDLIYEQSVGELNTTMNAALSYVFYDRNFKLNIELSDKRGKSLVFNAYNGDALSSLKAGMGMGINCAISAILHLYFLNCKGKKVLMLDEAYSNISVDYVDQFYDFFYKMVHKLGFRVILITHDPRFLKYGDKTYTINCGEVKCLTEK